MSTRDTRSTMSGMEEKSMRIIEFSGKQADWDGWSKKFHARAKRREYKGLLLGRDKVPMQDQLELAEDSSSESNKKIIKLGELNTLAYKDIVLSINHTTSSGKVAFSLIKNCKSNEFPEGNFKLTWERLVKKYEPLSRRAASENKCLPCSGIKPETTRQNNVFSCSQFFL